MASFRSTKLKITIGYILLLAILLFSLVFVHQEILIGTKFTRCNYLHNIYIFDLQRKYKYKSPTSKLSVYLFVYTPLKGD